MPNDKTNPTVFGAGARLVKPYSNRGNNTLGISGIDLMRKINDGLAQKATSDQIKEVRYKITQNCEEIIEQGARIRPLIVDGKQLGWVRGLHISERKLLSRWIFDTNDFIKAVLSVCTTFKPDEVEDFSGIETRRLVQLVTKMSEFDLSLYPYLSAYTSTSSSENLWYSRGTQLASYENREIKFPDGQIMKILTPPDHARLWATLCNYREASKLRLDANFNALLIIQPWAGKNADPVRNELKAAQRSMQVDSSEPWEQVIRIDREINLEDGWGHSMQDDSREGLQREMRGMIEGTDKHEKLMERFYQQQKEAAEARKREFDTMLERRGGPGVFTESMKILTDAEVKQREQNLKKGRPLPPAVAEREVFESPGKKIQRYR
jgi:hypothetical protein